MTLASQILHDNGLGGIAFGMTAPTLDLFFQDGDPTKRAERKAAREAARARVFKVDGGKGQYDAMGNQSSNSHADDPSKGGMSSKKYDKLTAKEDKAAAIEHDKYINSDEPLLDRINYLKRNVPEDNTPRTPAFKIPWQSFDPQQNGQVNYNPKDAAINLPSPLEAYKIFLNKSGQQKINQNAI